MIRNTQDAISHLITHDSTLAQVIRRYPAFNIQKSTDYYQSLVGSIVSQQLSVKAAKTIGNRLKDLFGSSFYPNPEQILLKDAEELRAVGLSRPKAGYIIDLAHHVKDRKIDFKAFDQMSNQQIMDELIAIKGIGEWTAHMFLIFCMGRLDVLPTGDLGIKNGVQKLYHLDVLPGTDKIIEIATKNHWHPYESVAAWYIWQSLDNKPLI